MGVLKAKVNGVWEDISGVTTNEVAVDDTDPRQGAYRNATLWIDTSTDPPLVKFWSTQINPAGWVTLSSSPIPLGGSVGHALVKASATDGDVRWSNPGVNVVLDDNLTVGDNVSTQGDGRGFWLNGGGAFYKKSGAGVVLRESSGGQQPQIEDNGGGSGRDIIDTTNGDARYVRKSDSIASVSALLDGCGFWASMDKITYNDLVVCWHVAINTGNVSEQEWRKIVDGSAWPSNLRPSTKIEKIINGSHSDTNATAMAIRVQLDTDGSVHWQKPRDGPDITGSAIFSLDFVYARNY